jgi:glycosyltransferase involved in cell wall biosynthesis
MDQKPMVSVVMITYNHEKYIAEAMNGVFMQKCDFDIEFIIANDKSTDETDRKILEYLSEVSIPKNIKIEYANHEQNKGVSKNFKWALQQASGKYIAYCEGDDYWTDPLKLQKQVDFLEENPDYVVTSHNARVINTTGETLKQRKLPKLVSSTSYSQQALKKGMHLLTLTMVYRNVNFISYFEEDFQNILNADTYLISCLGFYGKGMYLEDIQDACYRVHDGGVWSKKSEFTKFKNLINTYSSLYKLHFHENSEPNVLEYFEKLLSTLSNKMILNADKRISFSEFKNSIPIYFKFSKNSQNYTVFKATLLLIYRKLNLNTLRKKLK